MLRFNLFRNTGLKLISVLLAGLLWLFVENEKTGLKSVEVALEYTNTPETLVLMPESRATVTAVIRGPEALLPRLREGSLTARVDLRAETYGEIRWQLNPEDVSVPYWAEVERVEPQQFSFELDNKASKVIPVLPELKGSVADGFVFKDYVVNPSKVTIAGPKSIIDGVREIWTEPLVIDGKTESFQQTVELRANKPGIVIESAEEHIVQVVIVPEMVERYFEGVPVVAENQRHVLELGQDSVEVWLGGPRLLLDRIRADRLSAVLDMSGLTPRAEGYELAPTIRFTPPLAERDQIEVSFYPPGVRVRLLDKANGNGLSTTG
jgi:YbbR domain-containing protein